jgi:hypothetical protein
MDVDINYSNDTQQRFVPGISDPTTTGNRNISFNPRFSYQITRNLSGALRLSYSRKTNIQSDLVRQSLGLGLEATFVF